MQVPWFFATTPAPHPTLRTRRIRPATPWWTRLADRYVAWAERSQRDMHDSRSLM